ncbi:MAG: YhjD/YihY/BrkB family envelope integrity protein [Candidatus Binatia bacterium]
MAESRWTCLARAALHKYHVDLLSVRAAALSYWTLLSLVPFLAVTFSVLKAFGVEDLIEAFLLEAFEPLGSGRTEITKRLVGFVGNAEAGVLGAAGVAGLFYTVVSLIGNIEEALNQIWRAQPIRAWTRRYGEYLGLLLVGPVLMFAALALIASAQSYWMVQSLIEMRVGLGPVIALLARVSPFFFLWAGFTVLYKIMPSADVRLRSALFGAAVAAILWQLAGMAFTAFVADSVNYRAMYSGFAVAVVFFIWLNLAWLIVLLGGMVAYLHQHARIFMRGWPAEMADSAFEEWLVLSVLSEIARRYLSGNPPVTESGLSDRLGVPLAQIERVVDKCVRRGLLLRSAEPPGISLARAPENVSAAEMLETVRGELIVPTTTRDALAKVLRRRDAALRHGLEGISLKSLIHESLDDIPQRDEVVGEMRNDH